jgi:tripartite-type tricarboxylate transporter receptor subunit TctC
MKRIDRSTITAWIGAALVSAAVAGGAAAQSWPVKPIRVITPFGAGDSADTIARLIAPRMSVHLGGQPLIIDNRPGASGLVGLQVALQAEADGYTLVLGQMGGMAVAPNVNKQPFDVRKEFVAIAATFSNYLVLASYAGLPQKTFPDVVAFAKANPGKLRMATNGEGGFPHLAMELLKERTGFDFLHIPYKGSSQIPTDLISGRIELAIAGYSSLLPHIQSGKVHAIATTGAKRPPNLPNVPTLSEHSPGFTALGWFGFFGRRGVPEPVIASVNRAVNAALAVPEVLERARAMDLDPEPGTTKAFQAMWAEDYERWGRVYRGLKLGPR